MKKESPQIAAKTDVQQGYLATIFINSAEYECVGNWCWELHCDAIFCSDVMLNFPPDFAGTKGIIHPSDKDHLLQHIAGKDGDRIPYLQFRMITTWGEIKTLTGKELQVSEVKPFFEPDVTKGHRDLHGDDHHPPGKVELPARAYAIAEGLHKTGTWWLHIESNEMHYSDGVFYLYDLPAQSFNAHLHTFFSYIFDEDREAVLEAFGTAFRRRAPLHIDFRVQTAKGFIKTLRQITHWEWSAEGELILYGAIQDITERDAMEGRERVAQFDLRFTEQLLKMNEQSWPIASWSVNLMTRKASYSESIYRLYGVKQQNITGSGINLFLNYVHFNDRQAVEEVTRTMMTSHVAPDMDFRIVRPDGKIRYARQKGRLATYGEGEMVMMLTIQDITPEKISESRVSELQQLISTAEFAKRNLEEMAAMGSWFLDVETENLTWSEGLYGLLGLKTTAIPPSQKALLQYVHPEDQKKFRDEWKLVLREGQESNFEFRIIRNGQILYLCAWFKIFNYGGKVLFIGTLQDLTKQQDLKLELAHRIRISEAITENMPDQALLTDEENTIIFWNKQAEVVHGIKREQALNKNFFDIFPELKATDALQLFQQAWKGEPVWMPHIKSPGSNVFHNLLLVPVRSESGNISAIMHLARDVTKEHQMERHLTERAHFIECLVNASVNRLIIMDRHMNYLYCNDQAAALYGLNKEEIIGKNVLEVFPASINDPTFSHFRRALKGEKVKVPAIDGFLEESNYEVHLLPIKDDNDTVTAVVWTHYKREEENPLLTHH